MSITPALSSALSGIQKGLTEMNKTAANVAGANAFNQANAADLARSMVELQTSRQQVELSAKVLKSVDDTLGTLLDVTA